MTITICKISLMKRAWSAFKAQGWSKARRFGECLKAAWAELKRQVRFDAMPVEQHQAAIARYEGELYLAEMGCENYRQLCTIRASIERDMAPHKAALKRLAASPSLSFQLAA